MLQTRQKIWAPKMIFGLLSKYCWTFLWETGRKKTMLTIWHLGKMDMVIAFHYLMNIISDKYAKCFPGQDSGETSEIWAKCHGTLHHQHFTKFMKPKRNQIYCISKNTFKAHIFSAFCLDFPDLLVSNKCSSFELKESWKNITVSTKKHW